MNGNHFGNHPPTPAGTTTGNRILDAPLTSGNHYREPPGTTQTGRGGVPPPLKGEPPQPHMTEAELQRSVLELAAMFGWRVAHFRAARTAHGWRTAVAADGAGFPDLVLVHPEHGVIFAELKSSKGTLTDEQRAWAVALTAARARWYCWRPSDWPEVVATLSNGRASA